VTTRAQVDALTVGSLFSGIGGLDLGLERAGMIVRWQSEIDPYCCRVLAKHWPHVPNLGDVKTIDWSTVEPVDLICGGYPCQPFSLAGVRRGEADPRHLWPFFRDALRHLRPRFALLENVPGHLSLGFGTVLGDLAALGYDCEWDCIPAATVGAPHLRYRVFVVAHANSQGEPGQPVDAVTRSRLVVPDAGGDELQQQPIAVAGRRSAAVTGDDGTNGPVADAGGQRRERWAGVEGSRREAAVGGEAGDHAGHSRWWATEPDVGRVAHGVPYRMDRLRALGNAVVPQVAEWVGRRIIEAAA
jgi:DNA (cytosine-5)-methyltransferase 1